MKTHFRLFIFAFTVLFTTPVYSEDTASNTNATSLTLSEAFALAEQFNPGLLAAGENVNAVSGSAIQAGLPANPSLIIGFDEFAGSGRFSGTSAMKSSMGLSQRIITAGKRRIKASAAGIQLDISRLELRSRLLDLKIRVAHDFIQVYLLQKLIDIQQQSIALAKQVVNAVKKRVIAGEALAIDETRADVVISSEEVAYRRLMRELESSRTVLASNWDSARLTADMVTLNPETIMQIELPTPESIDADDCPEVAGSIMLVRQKDQELALADAELTPDVSISASLSRFRENDDRALEVEIEFELPLFDRHQGLRREARAAHNEARNLQQAKLRNYHTRISTIHNQINSLRDELENVNNHLLPSADRAYCELNRAYNEGERELIDLLDAGKSYLEAARTRLTLQHELLEKVAEYAIITGNEADLLNKGKEKKEDDTNE